MSKFFYLVVTLIFLLQILSPEGKAQAAVDGTRLLRFPTISDNHIVFTYANDLWLVPRAGGRARQLTSHPGNEFFARLSPDGKWIAFSAQYSGDYDVYLVPVEGREPRRLTYYPG